MNATIASISCAAMAAGVALAAPDRAASSVTPGIPDVVVRAYQDAGQTLPPSLFHDLAGKAYAGGQLASSCNVFLVQLNGRNILVDTGNGAPRGSLREQLVRDGIRPETVTDVLITHTHGDHIGGLLLADGRPAYPEATVYIPAEPTAEGTEALRKRFAACHAVAFFDPGPGAALPEGFSVRPAYGHTPRHVVYELKGRIRFEAAKAGGAAPLDGPCKLVDFVGDLVHGAELQFPHPDFCARWDADPAKAVVVRKAEIATALRDGRVLAGAHIPFPGLVTLARNSNGEAEMKLLSPSRPEKTMSDTIYGFTVKNRKGEDVSLADYKGKVVLIVNTATGCGFTPQYADLEKLYGKYHDKGFEILDFPCDQFGHQAPGSDDDIHQFCTLTYHTTFPRFSKIEVNGANAVPLFQFLVGNTTFGGFDKDNKIAPILEEMLGKADPDYAKKPDIKWNFTKFLIGKDGKIVKRYEPTAGVGPIDEAIAKLLAE